MVKVNYEGGIVRYSQIDDEEEFNYVINKIFLNHKVEINEFFE